MHQSLRPPRLGKLLLDADGIARTLSRIAHEIIERNPELDAVALVGIHTRGVPLAQRLRRLIEECAGVEVAARHASTSPSTATTCTCAAARRRCTPQPLVRATRLDFPLEGRPCVLVDDVLYTGRTIRAAIEALFDYGRPARVQLAVLADRGHRELPIRPDYVGKNLPTARGERVQVQLVEVDEVDRVPARRRAEEAPPMADIRVVRDDLLPARPPPRRHLISIGDLTRDDVERLLATARSFDAVARARVKKLPTLRGRTVVNALLRVLDAHVVELRARGQAPLGGHDVDQGARLGGRQGRVAEGHRAHARRLRPRRDRDPPPAHRRAAPRRARYTGAHVVNAGDGKHQHPTQALLDLYTIQRGARPARGRCTSRSSATSSTRASRARSSRRSRSSARASRSSARRRCPARDRGARLRGLRRHRRDRATPTSSTCCACSASGCRRARTTCPSLREYTARWGVTPERLRPGQKVMHPGPMNRGVEIDPRVADAADALIDAQVRAGLVVRMAVLYDLLTAGPVAGPGAAVAEVA